MSHTPGPWTAAADKTLEGLNVYAINGPGVCGWVADVNRAAWQKSSEANAKLIAAAPDLLEALQGLLNVVQRTPAAQDGFNLISISRARDAIRTALGDDKAA